MQAAHPESKSGIKASPFAVDAMRDDDHLYARIAWRLLPLLLIGYILAYVDRVNVGFAKLQMQQALNFSDAAFGLGAGIMFIGYFMLELPSNMLLERIGARKTLLRIMVLWGATTIALLFVTTPTQFYVLRFMLGAFEAGFFPGVILYLTYWFPSERRGRVIGIFMSGSIVAGIITGPVSGATMKFLDGAGGWQGWQWLFLTQGVPPILLGLVMFWWLDDRPSDAKWLSASDRARIAANLGGQASESHGQVWRRLGELFRDPKVWALALADFLLIGAAYTMVFWMPTMIRGLGVSDVFSIGLYSAIPNIVGAVAMILATRSSDLRRERRWHFVAAALVGSVGLFATTWTQGLLIPSMVALCVAAAGLSAGAALFIAAASDYLPPHLAAAGIPMITSLAILGGAVSPAITGLMKTLTGQDIYGIYVVASALLLSALTMAITLRNGPRGR